MMTALIVLAILAVSCVLVPVVFVSAVMVLCLVFGRGLREDDE